MIAIFAGRHLAAGEGWRSRLTARLRSFQEGFAGLRSARAMAACAFFTVVLWTFMVLFEFLMLRAFGFTELGLAHGLGLLVVLSFAIALPQAPAGVGVVQIASETTLTALYGMPIGRAKAFAIGLWICQVGVVVGAGLVALWIEGLSLADVREARDSIEELQEAWRRRSRPSARAFLQEAGSNPLKASSYPKFGCSPRSHSVSEVRPTKARPNPGEELERVVAVAAPPRSGALVSTPSSEPPWRWSIGSFGTGKSNRTERDRCRNHTAQPATGRAVS